MCGRNDLRESVVRQAADSIPPHVIIQDETHRNFALGGTSRRYMGYVDLIVSFNKKPDRKACGQRGESGFFPKVKQGLPDSAASKRQPICPS